MTENIIKEGKTLAIVSYMTFIGLIIAIIMNLEKRNPFTFFPYKANVRTHYNAIGF